MGTTRDYIAVGFENQRLMVFKCDAVPNTDFIQRNWTLHHDEQYEFPVWRVSWSPIG